MTQVAADYTQSSHATQQAVDETASAEDDLELVGMFAVNPGYWCSLNGCYTKKISLVIIYK
jgi:hypothetical protein